MLRLPAAVAIAAVWASLLAAACDSHPKQGSGSAAAGSAGGAGGSTGAAAGSAGSPGSAGSAAAVGSASAATAPKPKTTAEQVQQGAPAGTKVAPAELTVPGIELFALTEGKTGPDDDAVPVKLVGVAGGVGGKLLDGHDLVRAVIDAKPDPRTLARVALWATGDDSEVLDAAKGREQAKARPPAIAKGALVFWVWTHDVPRMVEKARLDLTTGALEIAPPKLPRAALVSNAMTTLGSTSVSRHAAAIKLLAGACTDPRARQALLGTLGNHPRVKTRVAAASEARWCGAAAVGALVTAMEQDKSAQVRAEAAGALGRIGDARARPALAKAARGDDANLAWTANNALKKLK
ncbi:MAG TPA: HEAT repeat domain-containing protein [Kofleriaceae bacterium]|jgi:hypothetical protein